MILLSKIIKLKIGKINFSFESCSRNSFSGIILFIGDMESVETINENDFLELYNSRTYNSNCFNKDCSLNKNYNSFKTTDVIYPNGFYVYAEPKKFKDINSGVEYVTRYCGRVPISENIIVNYDGSTVTFYYIGN